MTSEAVFKHKKPDCCQVRWILFIATSVGLGFASSLLRPSSFISLLTEASKNNSLHYSSHTFSVQSEESV